MKNYLLTYGSLRKGQYNYNAKELEYIDTIEISGYKLYSLGAYPGIKYTGNEEDIIICDILNVKTNKESNAIDYMELYADYSIASLPVILNKVIYACKLYIYNGFIDENNLIKHGDWSKYLKENCNSKNNTKCVE